MAIGRESEGLWIFSSGRTIDSFGQAGGRGEIQTPGADPYEVASTTHATDHEHVNVIGTTALLGVMKKCSGCREEKGREEFNRRSISNDGLSHICKECARIKTKAWREANRARHRAYSKRWAELNPGAAIEHSKRYRERNKTRRAQICRAWNERNQDKRAEALARRRAKIFTPVWADKAAISAFYSEAKRLEKETGGKYHVDHIVPLNSDLVCGLHVETNLQVIPARENVLKRNLVWPDMP